MRKKMLAVAVLITGIQYLAAQEVFQLKSDEGTFKVTGTSTLHEWEMEATRTNGKITVKTEDGVLKGIREVDLSVKSEGIRSGNSIMDQKTTKALVASKYPEIRFKSESVSGLTVNSKGFSGRVNGTLTISGVAKKVSFPFSGSVSKDELSITGSYSLNMSAFGIDPPTAMMGTLKTGDEVKIIFNTVWENRGGLVSLL